ncbi:MULTISPECIES: type II toxin-antitoxin system Phd/YefM family antitoxin [unclassified Pseudomonas]|jgi:antitoxin (DNA-binding transcriptional repressor) of toxin-antitoxin stability system|uniref:type II toxin-antitoxin system Phd/YefM family antitoxin n=1 Tax=unclassified Pseudomonas TaxID=196821 RepID=UPI000BA4C49D|nr:MULTISPECIES: type II toxin-antitoxin system prevent-host-death family antitoxin [unclassified Pseudomonas]MDN4546886.1 type II toxin-antitoxin system prevent-host-death family antitoxin [Pseudomonas sp. C32]
MNEVVQVNMHEAKSQLSQLAERVWRGDKVVIAKAGKPYLDLLPHVETPRARKPGRLKGKIRMSADFDKTPEDIIDGFEGSL